MKLSSNDQRLAECKVLILYILNKIQKPISKDNLLQLILAVDDMNYFYFQQFLLDLVEIKYVETTFQNDEKLYKITESGIKTLDLTLDILPGIMKFKVDNKLKDELNDIEEAVSVTSEVEPYHLTEFIVTCKIIEKGNPVIEVKTIASDREKAKAISENWKKNSNKIYPQILNLLLKEKKKK